MGKNGKIESTIKKPIRRELLIKSMLILLIIGVLTSVLSYFFVSSALYKRYDSQLNNVLTYVDSMADADDLRECLESGVTSEKYNEYQQFLNGFIDKFNLMYLYIVIPEDDVMVNLISATSDAERAEGAEDMPLLEQSDAYSAQELARYRAYWDSDDVGYFKEASDWGTYYTACKPMRDSNGETVALICADVSVELLEKNLNDIFLYYLLWILLEIIVIGAITLIWIRKRITDPITA
ncbi:MAG: GGDEF domain-containing protein, partial [Clostridia bacterium]|nr:GGDEF domain-containing protein [Clostridia bacterium]